jgi:hypothetical protein
MLASAALKQLKVWRRLSLFSHRPGLVCVPCTGLGPYNVQAPCLAHATLGFSAQGFPTTIAVDESILSGQSLSDSLR